MPMSRRPRSDWLGSSTSPPLMTRSNLSSRPIAAIAEPPAAAASVTEAAPVMKWRREMRLGVLPSVVVGPLFDGHRHVHPFAGRRIAGSSRGYARLQRALPCDDAVSAGAPHYPSGGES